MSKEINKPTTCIVIGMVLKIILLNSKAGSGKTTLMQRINSYVHTKKIPRFFFFLFIFSSYILNLDPAVNDVPYNVNIDIRDTVNYKKVMKEYNLGPNGGILTSLNLFATRFGIILKTQHLDQVITLIEKKDVKYTFVDTPVIFIKN
jgi:GPN-loop GTPase